MGSHAYLELAANDALDAMVEGGEADQREYCLHNSLRHDDDATLSLARAYLSYVDQGRSVRETCDSATVLERAFAEQWPCPR